MNWEQWLAANGYDLEQLSEKQRKHLEAAWKAEYPPPATKPPETAPPATNPSGFDAEMAAINAENERINFIREATVKAMKSHLGDSEKTKQIEALCQAAVANTKTDKRAFELELLRTCRALGPMVLTPRPEACTDDVIEAALCMTERLPNVEKHFNEQTLQTAHTRFRHGLGLQEFLVLAAERNGNYRGSIRDLKPLLKAAFHEGDSYGMRAEGPSTIQTPGILSNVANKFLRVGFMNVDQAWRRFCAIGTFNDFKVKSIFSLTGDLTYEETGPGGEIKHGTLGEQKYTNQAKSFSKLLGIDRRDIVNDDLGAYTSAGKRLGRGGALKLNLVIYAAFLADTTFFPTDKSKSNYDDGTDSVLSLAGLTNADNIFRSQTDPDGNPLGIIPRVLLTPSALRVTAWNLCNSQFILPTGVNAAPSQGTDNGAFRGMYDPVATPYLSAANGGSDTAWYLLADPSDLPVIEVGFLYGVEFPTIESGEMEIDRLGIAMRGYHDFGASLQEYRAGVKMKGTT